jgi:uncharacterized protein YbjQ (UPF0145 family)
MIVEILFLAGLVLALVTGTIIEKRHYRSIKSRESSLGSIPCSSFRAVPAERPPTKVSVAVGAATISSDRFKIFLGNFMSIFGGELKTHSSVIDRARREAILRMKESCPWADCFVNLRLETSNISQKHTKAAVIAYSTAVSFR